MNDTDLLALVLAQSEKGWLQRLDSTMPAMVREAVSKSVESSVEEYVGANLSPAILTAIDEMRDELKGEKATQEEINESVQSFIGPVTEEIKSAMLDDLNKSFSNWIEENKESIRGEAGKDADDVAITEKVLASVQDIIEAAITKAQDELEKQLPDMAISYITKNVDLLRGERGLPGESVDQKAIDQLVNDRVEAELRKLEKDLPKRVDDLVIDYVAKNADDFRGDAGQDGQSVSMDEAVKSVITALDSRMEAYVDQLKKHNEEIIKTLIDARIAGEG